MSKISVKNKIKQLIHTKKKGVAWLIDPDQPLNKVTFSEKVKEVKAKGLDFFFVGGSLVSQNNMQDWVEFLKAISEDVPVVLFPGNQLQFSENADAILFLSLVSGRNPEYLIGQHVTIAPLLARSGMEILPTAYLLIDGGRLTSVNYISQTLPLPSNKPDLSVATALAAKFLGMTYFYLDTGSGAEYPVPAPIIQSVRAVIDAPIIVGGGLNTLEKVKRVLEAGADLVVIGNGAEKNPDFIIEVLNVVNEMNELLNVNEGFSSSHFTGR
jgi:phosphoglycerol geranylgeranyltransferase